MDVWKGVTGRVGSELSWFECRISGWCSVWMGGETAMGQGDIAAAEDMKLKQAYPRLGRNLQNHDRARRGGLEGRSHAPRAGGPRYT